MNGDIFEADCEAMVNPVNCVGVMGGGLALDVKIRFPDVFKQYTRYCKSKLLKPGEIHMAWRYGTLDNPEVVFNLATKDHWRDPSKLEWIEQGAKNLIEAANHHHFKSVAVPALGTGLGGLSWGDVKIILINTLSNEPGVVWAIYEPMEKT